MTLEKLASPAKIYSYPGWYVPAPLMIEDLLVELETPLEGRAKTLVNMVEMKDAFVIELAAPGLKSDDFIVRINGNMLSISVLHKDPDHCKKTYHLHEFNYNCFKKDITIPENVDPHFISTVYANGILYVRLPKTLKTCLHRIDRILVY